MGFVAGMLGGLLAGLFGVGGGIILVPALGLLLGLGQQDAQGVTLAVLLLPIGLPALLAYRRKVEIRWRLVGAMIGGFVVTVAPGAWAANDLDARQLRGIFAGFVVIVAVRMWRRGRGDARSEPVAVPVRPSDWNGVWIGALGGFLSGLLGVGGAVIMIPFLLGVMRLDQHEAQATTLAVMLPPVGLPGVLAYAHARHALPWVIMAWVAAGFLVGALAGAQLAVRMHTRVLARVFAVFLLGVAARLAWATLAG
ncbi:MAG: sulfite exporter TauE/SafE family protein [Deltaproteobacteria bacterium]